MILQALYELANTEGLVDDPDFDIRPVSWLVRVGPGGRLCGIQGTHDLRQVQRGKKTVTEAIPKPMRVPKRLASRSGKTPPCECLADNAKFVFGLGTADKPVRRDDGAAAMTRFRAVVEECANATHDEGALAMLRFLAELGEGKLTLRLNENTKSNDLFAFVYEPDGDQLVSDRPSVESWVRHHINGRRASALASAQNRCLVTGASGPLAPKHEKLKNLPGGNTSGTALVSCNQRAFESYGWRENENAPVGIRAAETCGRALNRLLSPAWPDPHEPQLTLGRRNLRIGQNTVVCYWASSRKSDTFLDCLGGILEATEESVAELFRSIWHGNPVEAVAPDRFYALTLSGAEGRAIVRSWLESTVSDVSSNLAAHFRDLDCVRNFFDSERAAPLGLRRLLDALAPQGGDSPPHLAAAITESALQGRPYPFLILQRAIERARAEIGSLNAAGRDRWVVLTRMDARAALLKAFLNRWRRFHPHTANWKEVRRDMDPLNDNRGYLLGRLMAVLERLQQAALGNDVNATIVDRFFSGASASPRIVFNRLMKNAMHHVRKAQDDQKRGGIAFSLDRMRDDIMSRFEPQEGGIPARLALEEQGLFILGYHHMRHWLWLKDEEREEWERQHPAAPRAYVRLKNKSEKTDQLAETYRR